MAADYVRIRELHHDDGGTAGSQGETQWQRLLEGWLPAYYHVVKGGRVFHNGHLSGQLDVLVLDPAYPPALRDEQTYHSSGVVAAFQCKNTLESSHITAAAETASELAQSFCQQKSGTPFDELYRPYFYGVLAHSHSWKAPKSTPKRAVVKALERGLSKVGTPSQMIDVVCVADLATWGSFRSWQSRSVQAGYFCIPHEGTNPKRGGSIGAFLWQFLYWLAYRDAAVERLLGGLILGGVGGDGTGITREWPQSEILTPSLIKWLAGPPSRNPTCLDSWRGR